MLVRVCDDSPIECEYANCQRTREAPCLYALSSPLCRAFDAVCVFVLVFASGPPTVESLGIGDIEKPLDVGCLSVGLNVHASECKQRKIL